MLYTIVIIDVFESVVHHVLASRTEFLIALYHLVDRLNQVLLRHRLAPVPDREHPRLSAHRPQLSPSSVRTQTAQQLVPNPLLHRHRFSVDLENMNSPLQVRQRKFDLSIDSAWTHECGVQSIWSIGSHQDLDVSSAFEAVHLIDDFQHRSLNFVVSS